MNKIVTAIGSSCIDEYYEVDKMPGMGEKVNGRYKGNMVGGMIGNAASVLSGYGLEVYIVDFLEDSEESNVLKEDLIKYNIKLDAVSVSKEYYNNRCLILLDKSGERSIVILSSKNKTYKLNQKQIEVLSKSDYIYTNPADLRKIEDKEIVYDLISKHNVKLVFDVEEPAIKGPEDFEMLSKAEIIFMNEKEMEVMNKYNLFNKLLDGKRLVVVTLGESGSRTYTNGKVIEHDVRKVKVVDTTGAGDTYNSSYLYGISQGWSIEKCGKFASVAASEKIKREGPRSGVRDKNEILNLI